jgi:hypothetical protein
VKKALELLRRLTADYPPDEKRHHGLYAEGESLVLTLVIDKKFYGFTLDLDDMEQPLEILVERIRVEYTRVRVNERDPFSSSKKDAG